MRARLAQSHGTLHRVRPSDPAWPAAAAWLKLADAVDGCVKRQYDPDGLFFVHNGVGSEDWSEDGFTRLVRR